jgi:hypothetical protein
MLRDSLFSHRRSTRSRIAKFESKTRYKKVKGEDVELRVGAEVQVKVETPIAAPATKLRVSTRRRFPVQHITP